MSTLRQKKLARAIVDNIKAKKPKNKQELVVSSGYSVMSAESSAHLIIEQKGVIDALEDFGFSESKAKEVVGRVLTTGKEENQIRAADMIFKVHGTYAPERRVNLNIDLEPSQEVKELAEKLNAV